jgi:hypothetical protein
MTKLGLLLSWWKRNLETVHLPTGMAFLFNGHYGEDTLSYDSLGGSDLEIAARLREACLKADFCFYLANLERTVYGDCEVDDSHDCDRPYDRSFEDPGDFHEITHQDGSAAFFTRIVCLDGSEVAQKTEFNENLLIQTDAFREGDPDREEYQGPSEDDHKRSYYDPSDCNHGATTTHYYQRTVGLVYVFIYFLPQYFFLRSLFEFDWPSY